MTTTINSANDTNGNEMQINPLVPVEATLSMEFT